MTLYDFLEIYDVDNNDACDEIIKFFEQAYVPQSSGLKAFNRNRQKICSTLTLSFAEDWDVNDHAYGFVKNAIGKYRDKYSYLDKINDYVPHIIYRSIRVRRKDTFPCIMKLLVPIPIAYLHGWFI